MSHRLVIGLSWKSPHMLALWILYLGTCQYLNICCLRREGTGTGVYYFKVGIPGYKIGLEQNWWWAPGMHLWVRKVQHQIANDTWERPHFHTLQFTKVFMRQHVSIQQPGMKEVITICLLLMGTVKLRENEYFVLAQPANKLWLKIHVVLQNPIGFLI